MRGSRPGHKLEKERTESKVSRFAELVLQVSRFAARCEPIRRCSQLGATSVSYELLCPRNLLSKKSQMRLVMRFRLPGSLRLSGISGDISARCDLGRWVTCEEEEDSATNHKEPEGRKFTCRTYKSCIGWWSLVRRIVARRQNAGTSTHRRGGASRA